MSNQKQQQQQQLSERHFVISETKIQALQEFIGSLKMTWKKTNPYMGILATLPEIPAGAISQRPAQGQSGQAPALKAVSEEESPSK